MQKFIYNFTQYVMKIQFYLHKRRIEKLQKITQKASKNILLDDVELDFNVDNELKKLEVEKKVREIVKNSENTPEKILDCLKADGVNVYRIKNANLLLNFIRQEEGFIPPQNGINAFFLNLFINLLEYKKFVFSLKTDEMFVLRPLAVDIYKLIHQLYLYYAFKAGLSGYKLKSKKKFNQILCSMKDEDISKLSIDEILDMKDYIARDAEAIDLVVNIAKESEATTKLLNKIKGGQSVEL